jgi:hypothetical protein
MQTDIIDSHDLLISGVDRTTAGVVPPCKSRRQLWVLMAMEWMRSERKAVGKGVQY